MDFMKYSFGFVIALVLTNVVQGYFYEIRKIELDCAEETEISWKDVMDYNNNNMLDASSKVLCYFKCKLEKFGLLDEYGSLNMTLVTSRIAGVRFLPQSEKKELLQCIESIDTIKTCEDMQKIRGCITQLKTINRKIKPKYWKHKVECAEETGISIAEFFHFHHHGRFSSERFQCYIKCFYEREGRLTDEGELKIDVIDKSIHTDVPFLNNEQKIIYKECLRTVGPIETCEDAKQIIACFPDRRLIHRKRRAECLNELGLTENNEIIREDSDLQSITDKNLCYLKCMYQKDGSLGENGELNLDILNEHVDRMHRFTLERKTHVKACLRELPPIKNCEDMEYVFSCMK